MQGLSLFAPTRIRAAEGRAIICGVDLSTKAVDLVALDEDEVDRVDHLRVRLHANWWDSATNMKGLLLEHGATGWLYDRNVHVVGVERPYGPSRQALASLHTILGALIASLPSSVLPFEVTPQQMRHELGLKGNAPKTLMHSVVALRIGEAPDWPDDAYDAYAVAYATLRMNERGTPVGEVNAIRS